jgi:hypothetical protein
MREKEISRESRVMWSLNGWIVVVLCDSFISRAIFSTIFVTSIENNRISRFRKGRRQSKTRSPRNENLKLKNISRKRKKKFRKRNEINKSIFTNLNLDSWFFLQIAVVGQELTLDFLSKRKLDKFYVIYRLGKIIILFAFLRVS